jgi:hypothetical protein
LPDKSLGGVFAPAAEASKLDLKSSTKVTPLGETNYTDMQALFSFDAPSIGSLGWSAIPVLSFRVTLLGKKGTGHTLLAVIVPHIITDAAGLGGIIESWGRLYRGETVPTRTVDPHPDLMKLLDSALDNRHDKIKEDERPSRGFSYGLLGVISFFRSAMKFTANGIEERYIHFPRTILEKYRNEAREQLPKDHQGLPVSRFDIFCAMMIKVWTFPEFPRVREGGGGEHGIDDSCDSYG